MTNGVRTREKLGAVAPDKALTAAARAFAAYLAKTNNTLIVPANLGDMATLITSAMTMLDKVKRGEAKPA